MVHVFSIPGASMEREMQLMFHYYFEQFLFQICNIGSILFLSRFLCSKCLSLKSWKPKDSQ